MYLWVVKPMITAPAAEERTRLIRIGMNDDTVTVCNADEGDTIMSIGHNLTYTEILTNFKFKMTLYAHSSLTVYVAWTPKH